MNCLVTMSIEDIGTIDAIALRCAAQLILPDAVKLFPQDEGLEYRLKYRNLPDSLPTQEHLYAQRLHEEEARLRALEAMTAEEIEEAGRKEWANHEEARAELNARDERRLDACWLALKEARVWRPPSRRHRRLKHLMVSELEDEIERCQGDLDHEEISRPSAQARHDSLLRGAKRSIEHYRERSRTVVPEIKRWNTWLRELHEACGTPDPLEQDCPGERCAQTT